MFFFHTYYKHWGSGINPNDQNLNNPHIRKKVFAVPSTVKQKTGEKKNRHPGTTTVWDPKRKGGKCQIPASHPEIMAGQPTPPAVTRTGVLLSNTNQESSSRYGQERKTQAKDGPQRTGRTRSTQDLFLTSKCLAKAQGLTAQALFTTGCHANLEMDLLHQSKNFLG